MISRLPDESPDYDYPGGSFGRTVSASGPRHRRIKSSRRARSPVVAPSAVVVAKVDDDAPEGDLEPPEKIEVHVHVHRGATPDAGGNGAPTHQRRRRLTLNGALFDWKGHYDQMYRHRPPPGTALECSACGAEVPRFARSCRRCQTPQSRRGGAAKLIVALGIASVIGVFAVCSVLLNHEPTPESRATAPARPPRQ